jgi:hypothetical protein
LGELELRKIHAAIRSGNNLSLVVFVPSAERAERGENVDKVREQIALVGSLIKAAPDMEDGKVRFLFFLSTPEPLNVSEAVMRR